MKLLKYITNGVLLIIIGILHTHFVLSDGGFSKQFTEFSTQNFYNISNGVAELPATVGITNFETFSAFWFFYFGLLLFPLGLLVHYIEQHQKCLPNYFTFSYLLMVLIGCYMIPNSGMTIFMLPQAVYMLIHNHIKRRKEIKKSN